MAKSVHDEWLMRRRKLLNSVDSWATELGWSTREIEKRMQDPDAGTYQAPALLLQQETVRVLLEPITQSAPGAEGVVDLYVLPSFDDVASRYLVRGKWQLHYPHPDQPSAATTRDAEPTLFTKESLAAVLDAMKANAV